MRERSNNGNGLIESDDCGEVIFLHRLSKCKSNMENVCGCFAHFVNSLRRLFFKRYCAWMSFFF